MPDWVADKQRRAEKIRQAKAELEAEAKAAAEAKLKAEDEAARKREAEGRRKGGRQAAPCASNYRSQCSGRSSRHAGSASSCCAASTRCAPSGPSSAPPTIFSSSQTGGLCPPRGRWVLSRPEQGGRRDKPSHARPIHHRAWPTSVRHDNLDGLLERRIRQLEILAELGVSALQGASFSQLLDDTVCLTADGMRAEFCKV